MTIGENAPGAIPIDSTTSVLTGTITGAYTGTGVLVPGAGGGATVNCLYFNSSNASAGTSTGTVTAGTASSSYSCAIPSTVTSNGGLYVVNVQFNGDANYAAALRSVPSIHVHQTQTINFTAPTTPVTYGVSPIALVATGGGSRNPVTFSITSDGTFGSLSGTNQSIRTVTGAGSITIAANQAGSTNYSAASQPDQLHRQPGGQCEFHGCIAGGWKHRRDQGDAGCHVEHLGGPNSFAEPRHLHRDVVLRGWSAKRNSDVPRWHDESRYGDSLRRARDSGDSNFATASSTAVSEAVQDFSLAISTTNGNVTSVTALPGGTATYLLTISPTGSTTFPANVALTVGGLPTRRDVHAVAGLHVALKHGFGVRVLELDLVHTSLPNNAGNSQNDLRVGFGLSYRR